LPAERARHRGVCTGPVPRNRAVMKAYKHISLCEFAFATVPKRTAAGAAGVRSRFPVGAARGQGVDGISRHATWALGRSSCTRVSADVVRREPSGSAWDMYGKDADGDLLTPSAWHGGVMGLLRDRSVPRGAKTALL
jgi:hypothetical protein